MECRFAWFWKQSLDRLANYLLFDERTRYGNIMQRLNPYLNFNGNCIQAFDFYKSVFGGEFQTKMTFGEMPGDCAVDPSESNNIMHVSLPIGDSTLMGSDSPTQYGEVKFGNNYAISVNALSEEEADRLFGGLSAGGNAMMPMAKMFWGDYFGMVTDKFGVQWMISYTYPRNEATSAF